MKRIVALALLLLLLLCGCGEKKIVHCDHCGAEIEVDAKSDMNDEDWILFCKDCEDELYGDNPVVVPVE